MSSSPCVQCCPYPDQDDNVDDENVKMTISPPLEVPGLATGKKDEKWYCYILRNKNPKYSYLTYNGSTNNPKRRLRQHNEEISGGAKYTHGRGGGWEIYCLLTGFPDHKNALSCEWRIKHTLGKPRMKRPKEHCGPNGRIVAMNDILKLEKWTQQCTCLNSDGKFTLYMSNDVMSLIDINTLPSHVVFGGDICKVFL